MAETEYREIISFPPAVIFRSDLVRLFSLLSQGTGFTQTNFIFSATFSSRVVRANSLDELLAEVKEESTDKFSMETTYWSGNQIFAGVSLTLYHNYINCQLHSKDARWFHGTLEQLRQFFYHCRPWYRLLKPVIPIVSSVLSIVFATLAVARFISRDWPIMIVFLFIAIIFFIVGILDVRQNLFPYVRIYFRERRYIEWTPELIVLVIGLIVAILTVMVEILK